MGRREMDEVKKIKRMTKKVQTALEDYILHPDEPIKAIAERHGVSYGALRRSINEHQDYIREESQKIWESKVILAQRTMEALASRGNFRALDFILRSNGIVPEEKVTQTTNDLHITLESLEKE